MSATPRPWSADSQWWAGPATPLKYVPIKSGETVLASAANEEDADLIVTAVNAYDALVAAVEGVRALCDASDAYRLVAHGPVAKECSCHHIDPDTIRAILVAALGGAE